VTAKSWLSYMLRLSAVLAKRGCITILGAGSRRKIAIIILLDGGIDKSIISWGVGVMDLVTKRG